MARREQCEPRIHVQYVRLSFNMFPTTAWAGMESRGRRGSLQHHDGATPIREKETVMGMMLAGSPQQDARVARPESLATITKSRVDRRGWRLGMIGR